MHAVSSEPGRPEGELGRVLELLHRSDSAFGSVEVTYRTWRNTEWAAEARHASIEEQRRRGASIATYGSGEPSEGPLEVEEFLSLWRSGERVREEHRGGWFDGIYGVRRGRRWWLWNPESGAASNADRLEVGSSIGDRLAVMLEPAPLLASMTLEVTGHGKVAGRPTYSVAAVPRWRVSSAHVPEPFFVAAELGLGGDLYELEVDAERGVLLRARALRDGRAFHEVSVTAITFDHEIPEERFTFTAPEGESVEPTSRLQPQEMPIGEVRRRAAFTILVPERMPADWELTCLLLEPSVRPDWPGSVALLYRSEDGHHQVSLSEFPAEARESVMLSDGDWETVTVGGKEFRATRAGWGGETRAQLEQAGTFVIVTSAAMSREELIAVAGGLKPLPDSGLGSGGSV